MLQIWNTWNRTTLRIAFILSRVVRAFDNNTKLLSGLHEACGGQCLRLEIITCRQQTCVRRSFAKASASAAALRWRYALRAVRTTTTRMARASSGTTPAATASSVGLVRPITSSAPMTCSGGVPVHCYDPSPSVQAKPQRAGEKSNKGRFGNGEGYLE